MTGPCGLCGLPDSRHRVVDTIRERTIAGEPWGEVLADYGYTPAVYCRLAAFVDDMYTTRIAELEAELERTRQPDHPPAPPPPRPNSGRPV